jgi:hypothetical protein
MLSYTWQTRAGLDGQTDVTLLLLSTLAVIAAPPLCTLLSRRIVSAMPLDALIAPSVLASDFGQLAAECTRMIKNGADWLHMGAYRASLSVRGIDSRARSQTSWTGA